MTRSLRSIARTVIIASLSLWALLAFGAGLDCESRIGELAEPALSLRALPLRRLDSKALGEIKKGAKYSYVVDRDDHLWVLPGSTGLEKEPLSLVRNSSSPNAVPFLVTESGALAYDPERRAFSLRPENSLDLSEAEISDLLLDAKVPRTELSRDGSAIPRARALKCAEIVNRQSGGTRFIRDKLLADNLVTVSAIVTAEALGAGRTRTKKGKDVLSADMLGNNMASIVNSTLGKSLILRNVGLLGSWGSRMGTGFSLIAAQNRIYRATLADDTENGKKSADELSVFDTGFFVGRIPINHEVDRKILQQLPDVFFDACLKDAKTAIFISPTLVRIYERYSTTLIYYGLRKAAINE